MRAYWLFACIPAICAAQTPVTHKDACAKFSSAVVRIEAGGQGKGTGFIVSEDGYVLTANHVIRDENGIYFSAVSVDLPGGDTQIASIVTPLSPESVGQDYAILKVATGVKLPFLQLGTVEDVGPGDEATIIGYPFSALTVQDRRVSTRFCLSASVAATGGETVSIEGTNQIAQRTVPYTKDVQVDVIYFQGPSVKGISGSPVISRKTGAVIGIVSLKLTGIGADLAALKDLTARGLGSNVNIGGLNPGGAFNQVVTVLDDQLANGLGAATGIDDPKYALAHAKRMSKH